MTEWLDGCYHCNVKIKEDDENYFHSCDHCRCHEDPLFHVNRETEQSTKTLEKLLKDLHRRMHTLERLYDGNKKDIEQLTQRHYNDHVDIQRLNITINSLTIQVNELMKSKELK